MYSGTLERANDDISERTSSTSKVNNIEQAPSVKSSRKKKKLQQKTLKSSEFLNIIETFENALTQLQIDNVQKKTLDKLIKIEKDIKEKISLINKNKNDKKINENFLEKFSLSMESLNSEASERSKDIEFFSAEFLEGVSCPFCSMPQADKIKLIHHLDGECKPRIHKAFEKKEHLKKSAVQILPNNTFKCNICPSAILPNLLRYFKHLQDTAHISAYNKGAEAKNYTEFVFCSCCKIQIANNHTQIHFHMNHPVHKARSAGAINSEVFLKKKIYVIYIKSQKFKCLLCPSKYYKTPRDILKHFEIQNHVRGGSQLDLGSSLLFCEVCSEEIHMFDILNHFTLSDHKNKENEILKEVYELCFFCGFTADNLMDLSLHMDSQCSAINKIRKENPKLKKNAKNSLKEDKTTDKSDTEGGYVIVKDYKKIPMLYTYFEQFGEITSLKLFDKNHVMIKFKEKSIAALILSIRDKLSIDGVELEIMTDDEMLNSKERTNVSEDSRISSERENSLSYFDGSESEEDSDSNEDSDSSFNVMPLSGQMEENLFRKVTSHLMVISQKLDSTEGVKTVLNVLDTWIGKSCTLAGFSGCGLSFPVESISIYFSPLDENKSVNEHNAAGEILLKNLSKKMIESQLWQNVITSVSSFPHIKCRHKETQKICKITCAKPARLLTEMLRDCLKDNELVRSFCLLIRFWLGVHKLKIRKFEFVVMSLFVFFLISKRVVTLSREKYYRGEDFSLEEKIRDMFAFEENSRSEENKETFTLKELFHKFLKFLSTFDFDKLAIYLPLPYPLPKVFILKKLNKLSNCHETQKSSMYITQSDYLLNMASCVNEGHVKSLLKLVNRSIKSYRI